MDRIVVNFNYKIVAKSTHSVKSRRLLLLPFPVAVLFAVAGGRVSEWPSIV